MQNGLNYFAVADDTGDRRKNRKQAILSMTGFFSAILALLQIPWAYASVIYGWLFVFGDLPMTIAVVLIPSVLAVCFGSVAVFGAKGKGRVAGLVGHCVVGFYAMAAMYVAGWMRF